MTSVSRPSLRTYAAAVMIGRFQPFHAGHLLLLRQALAAAPLCVLVIGSAHQARTPKNPFTWQERAQMVRLAVPEADRARLLFLPVRDYYDEVRWTGKVRQGVGALLASQGLGPAAGVALVGHFKDASSEYLRGFPGWVLLNAEPLPGVDATSLRDALFGAGGHLDGALAALVSLAPQTTVDFLRAWSMQSCFPDLVAEWRMLGQYKQAWAQSPHPPVFVTADAVLRCADQVLLIRRGHAPGKGLSAVPGGFIEPRETVYQCSVRELREETHIDLLGLSLRQCLKEVAVFDHPDRSQRGRTITHAHYFDLGLRDPPEVKAGDDAEAVEWVAIDRLASMEDRFHDDHFHMLDHFLGLTGD